MQQPNDIVAYAAMYENPMCTPTHPTEVGWGLTGS